MDRWPCEYEGLTRRTRPDGRTEWVETARTCPAGHAQPMRPDWRRCAVCGFACRHWTCSECQTEVRDERHVCDGERPVDPGRR